jgi:hypothetical protein
MEIRRVSLQPQHPKQSKAITRSLAAMDCALRGSTIPLNNTGIRFVKVPKVNYDKHQSIRWEDRVTPFRISRQQPSSARLLDAVFQASQN